MTEEREHHLVLADQLIQQGDPRGELAILHDRIMQGDTALLPQACAIIEANLGEWLGFDAKVHRVELDSFDGDLRIVLSDASTVTMRWGFIDRYQVRDLDQLAQLWDRPAVRLTGFGAHGLSAGELRSFLEARDTSRIAEIQLAGATLNQADIEGICVLPKLRSFSADHCTGLDDDGLRFIAGRGLERLRLVGGTATPSVLERMPLDRLELLTMRDLRPAFDSETLFRLREAGRLRSLALGPLEPVPAGDLTWLGELQMLEHIDLRAVGGLGLPFLRTLAGMPALTRVYVGASQGSLLASVDSHSNIKIGRRQYSDELLESLCNLPFVRGIDLSPQPQLSDRDLRCLSLLPDLRSLSITDCRQLEGGFLVPLDHLRHLVLDHCTRIEDTALSALAAAPIQHLSLFGCNAVKGRFLGSLAHLRSLDLGRIELDDEAFELLLSQKGLRELDLSETTLSNARLRALVDAMPKLKRLSLRQSRGITSSGFLSLLDLGELSRVEVAGTRFRHPERFEMVAAFSARHEPLPPPKDLFD